MRRTVRFNDEPPLVSGEVQFFEPVPNLDEVRRHTRQPYNAALTSQLKRLPKGSFLLDAAVYPDVDTAANGQGEVVILDELAQGRKESRQGVVFGQLVVKTPNAFEKSQLVAVKPFELPHGAVHEDSAIRVVNHRIPNLNHAVAPSSLQPLGMCRLPEGVVGLITQYDHPITTYENLFWNDDPAEQTPERIAKALGNCGLAMGRLHAAGMTHQDGQVKNWGADNYGLRYVDLVDARFAPTAQTGRVDARQFADEIRYDLSMFVSSLTARAEALGGYGDALDGHFWTPYSDALTVSSDPVIRSDVVALLQSDMVGDRIAE